MRRAVATVLEPEPRSVRDGREGGLVLRHLALSNRHVSKLSAPGENDRRRDGRGRSRSDPLGSAADGRGGGRRNNGLGPCRCGGCRVRSGGEGAPPPVWAPLDSPEPPQVASCPPGSRSPEPASRAVPAFVVRRDGPPPSPSGRGQGAARDAPGDLLGPLGRTDRRGRSPVRGPRARCTLLRGAPPLQERERSKASRKEEDAMRYRGRARALRTADAGTRRRLASDLPSLTPAAPAAVIRHRKSGKDTGEWLPRVSRCWLAARVVAVKRKYRLTVDAREAGALRHWETNGNGRITCKEVRAHGIVPVLRGLPAYRFMRDGVGDGVVCE